MSSSTLRYRKPVLLLLMALPALTMLLSSADSASAQCATGASGFVPLECFQDSARLRGAYNSTELGPFIQKLFVGAISIGAILAVLRLAWAGFRYMSSDLWGTKEHAKEIIRETLLGLFLLIAIYLILWQINPDILNLQINPANFNPGV